MHKNTKRLRDLMAAKNLAAVEVAELTKRTTTTVRIWRVRNTKRVIPDELLHLLELATQGAARAEA